MKTLATWKGGDTSFKYDGSVQTGTTLYFGKNNKTQKGISVEQYKKLLDNFNGQTVKMGSSHDKPLIGSLGAWLKANVCDTATASYVSAILIEEGYAKKNKSEIIFNHISDFESV